jgi:2,3-bisphosphoglycerate-dependent phosphoglycerate mutase
MKKFIAAFVFVLMASACDTSQNDSITTFYLIRHAEKDRSEGVGNDPELTEAGHNRAERWAEVFGLEPLDAVYSTDYKRTRQTAEPSAQANALDLQFYDPNTLNTEALIAQHNGQRVLIVGHSNTTPFIVNKFLGEERFEWIDDAVNGNLYVVTIVGETIGVQILSIE